MGVDVDVGLGVWASIGNGVSVDVSEGDNVEAGAWRILEQADSKILPAIMPVAFKKSRLVRVSFLRRDIFALYSHV